MHTTNKDDAPEFRTKDGLVSRILHAGGDVDTNLAVTWVEVEPGGSQVIHSHNHEQVYVVISGEGRVYVDGDNRAVSAGELIHIPSNADHGIENTSEEVLVYISAATPAFSLEKIQKFYEE